MPCVCDPEIQDGHEYVKWVATVFQTCVYSPTDVAAFMLGLVNIGFWLFAQIPQVVATCKVGSAEALSFLFVFTWLTGDITNLLGCVMTYQLPTQTYTAVYFCIVDGVMMFQWVLFSCRARRRNKYRIVKDVELSVTPTINEETHPPAPATSNTALLCILLFITLIRMSTTMLGGLSGERTEVTTVNSVPINQHHQRVLLQYDEDLHIALSPAAIDSIFQYTSWTSSQLDSMSSSSSSNTTETQRICPKPPDEMPLARRIVGDICAWLSGLLYFFGRIPQVYHNYKRRSVKDLSWFMFACAFMGNTCYGLSIVLMKLDWSDPEFWENVFPYILGSWFTMIWPLLVLVQYFYYGFWTQRKRYNALADP
ncbi:PQ loop repeat protein [Pelomyxa schiedti]|nr:PQ loop repeat protein [Pelomyxa schiedti]